MQPSGVRTYYVQLGRGKRVRIGPAGTFTLAQAKERAKKIILDPAASEKKAGGTATLDEYIEHHYNEHALARLKNGAKSVARVQGDLEIAVEQAHRRNHGRRRGPHQEQARQRRSGDATVNRDVSALSGVFTHWVENTKGDAPPGRHGAARVWPMTRQSAICRPRNHKRLRRALASRDAAAAKGARQREQVACERRLRTLARDRGLLRPHHADGAAVAEHRPAPRRIVQLAWENIDLRLKTLTVLASHSKGNATRVVPLNAEALNVLMTIKPRDATGLVFKSPITGARFDNVKKAWAELTKAAELPGLRWHDLRHDFASQMVMRGVPLFTVQKLLGHANSRMTQRYAKLAPGTLADAVAVLGVRK